MCYYKHRKIVLVCDQKNMVDSKHVNCILEEIIYLRLHNTLLISEDF